MTAPEGVPDCPARAPSLSQGHVSARGCGDRSHDSVPPRVAAVPARLGRPLPGRVTAVPPQSECRTKTVRVRRRCGRISDWTAVSAATSDTNLSGRRIAPSIIAERRDRPTGQPHRTARRHTPWTADRGRAVDTGQRTVDGQWTVNWWWMVGGWVVDTRAADSWTVIDITEIQRTIERINYSEKSLVVLTYDI